MKLRSYKERELSSSLQGHQLPVSFLLLVRERVSRTETSN